MDTTINGIASDYMGIQNLKQVMEANTLVLKKAIDNQAQQATQIIESINQTPKLNTVGSVGTQIHVTA